MTNSSSPKFTGDTVVIDTSTLYELCADTGVTNPGTGKLHTYLELLPLLAKNGYRIVIPEIVAYEADQVLANGVTLKTWFPGHHVFRESLTENTALHDFLLSASQGKYGENIIVPVTDAPAKVSEYVNSIRIAAENKGGWEPGLVRAAIKDIQGRYKRNDPDYKMHFGDMAITEVVRDLTRKNHQDIYVFSDDKKYLHTLVKSAPMIAVANSNGLIAALVNSGLAAKIDGLMHASAEVLNGARRKQTQYRDPHANKHVIDCTGIALDTFDDTQIHKHKPSLGPLTGSFTKLSKSLNGARLALEEIQQPDGSVRASDGKEASDWRNRISSPQGSPSRA